MVITIDGPAGVGKSSSAKELASRLDYAYLDTGALYRAVAWKVAVAQIDPSLVDRIETLLSSTTLEIKFYHRVLSVLVDSREVSSYIRDEAIGRLASLIAAIPAVRDWLLPIQRRFAKGRGVVAEGRDMGTRVFPDAEAKFFLQADLGIRTNRRHGDIKVHDHHTSWQEVRQDLAERDARDCTRDVAPLRPAKDAYILDTSHLTVHQVVDRMLEVILARL